MATVFLYSDFSRDVTAVDVTSGGVRSSRQRIYTDDDGYPCFLVPPSKGRNAPLLKKTLIRLMVTKDGKTLLQKTEAGWIEVHDTILYPKEPQHVPDSWESLCDSFEEGSVDVPLKQAVESLELVLDSLSVVKKDIGQQSFGASEALYSSALNDFVSVFNASDFRSEACAETAVLPCSSIPSFKSAVVYVRNGKKAHSRHFGGSIFVFQLSSLGGDIYYCERQRFMTRIPTIGHVWPHLVTGIT